MTADRYAKLREAMAKATPGEWDAWDMDEFGWHVFAVKFGTRAQGQDCRQSLAAVRLGRSHAGRRDNYLEQAANAQYIAAASPATIAALLAERDRLREALRDVYSALRDAQIEQAQAMVRAALSAGEEGT
jgi:hypothetical protein